MGSLVVPFVLLVILAVVSDYRARSEEQNSFGPSTGMFENQLKQRKTHGETELRELKEIFLNKNKNTESKYLKTKIEELNYMLANHNRDNQLETEIKELMGILQNQISILQNLTNSGAAFSCLDNQTVSSRRRNVTVGQGKSIEVLYEQKNQYGGDWIVIQHRFDGSVDFLKNWNHYRNGFGSFYGEFWLGLENIHALTSSKDYELLIHLESFDGVTKFAQYGKFAIAGEDEDYALKTLESHSGTAGDSLDYSRGQKFTTYDRDNDEFAKDNCAVLNQGAWWYKGCSYSNLNGLYKTMDENKAMCWHHFNNVREGLKISKMMIRAV